MKGPAVPEEELLSPMGERHLDLLWGPHSNGMVRDFLPNYDAVGNRGTHKGIYL